MLREIDEFYLKQKEPHKSVFMALRDVILSLDTNITDVIKYKMPFFLYKQKIFCYFWVDKKTKEPYIGVVEGHRINHELLEQGNRSRIKIIRINTSNNLPLDTVKEILKEAMSFY